MSLSDFLGLVYSYVYAFALLLIVERIGKKLRWPNFVTRKIIHIGAGLWTWAILFLFDHWYIGIIPFATFIVLNYIFYRQRTFSAMDGEKESPGTIYFAVSITVLFLIGWRNNPLDLKFLVIPPIMIMTWGDAMASLFGKFKGKHIYGILGSFKSIEGSVMMFLFGFLAAAASLFILNGLHLSLAIQYVTSGQIFMISLLTAFIATFVEAFSPYGTDNLFVPLISAGVLYFAF